MMTRKEIEKQNRKLRILEVAETLFAEKGLHRTSVADIAQAAEFGIGTIYKYFKDKDSLIASLTEARINEHFDALETALAQDAPPPVLIERFIEAYLMSIQKRIHFFKVYYSHLHLQTDNETLRLGLQKLETRKMELFRRIDDIYQQGIEENYFLNVGNAGYLTAATWGILMAFYFMAEQQFGGTFDVFDVNELQQVIQQLLFEKVRLSA